MIQKISIFKRYEIFSKFFRIYSTKIEPIAEKKSQPVTEKNSSNKLFIGPKDYNIQSFLLKNKLLNYEDQAPYNNSKYFEKETRFFDKNIVTTELSNLPCDEKLKKKHDYYLNNLRKSLIGHDVRKFEVLIKQEERKTKKMLKLNEKKEKMERKKIEVSEKKHLKMQKKSLKSSKSKKLELKNESKQIVEQITQSPNEFKLSDEAKLIIEKNNSNNLELNQRKILEPAKIIEENSETSALKKYFIEQDIAQRQSKINRYKKFMNMYNINEKFLYEDLNQIPFLSNELVLENSNLYSQSEINLTKSRLFEPTEGIYENKLMPSVSNVIQLAYPLSQNLLNWQVEKAQTLTLEGFKIFSEQIKNDGKNFHAFIENRLLNKTDLIREPKLKSLEIIFKDIDQVLLTEADVRHSNLFYHGRIDCLAYYKGELCLIDWKSSEKSKSNIKELYDLPVQISAYIGAYLNDPKYESLRKEHKLKKGLLVNFNKQTGDVNIHLINYQLAEFYWYKWLNYLRNFWVGIKKMND